MRLLTVTLSLAAICWPTQADGQIRVLYERALFMSYLDDAAQTEDFSGVGNPAISRWPGGATDLIEVGPADAPGLNPHLRFVSDGCELYIWDYLHVGLDPCTNGYGSGTGHLEIHFSEPIRAFGVDFRGGSSPPHAWDLFWGGTVPATGDEWLFVGIISDKPITSVAYAKAWNNPGGGPSFDNLVFSSSVVPEPGLFLLLGTGLLGLAGVARFKST